ncbi:hypothetical protein LTR53_001852 [Teratosphaeriaceae sp. CCFEE 6253]|nr:hypothetical protein LTR53_001852 [Teratosphaeriaceae sp. CCFEE 6253]
MSSPYAYDQIDSFGQSLTTLPPPSLLPINGQLSQSVRPTRKGKERLIEQQEGVALPQQSPHPSSNPTRASYAPAPPYHYLNHSNAGEFQRQWAAVGRFTDAITGGSADAPRSPFVYAPRRTTAPWEGSQFPEGGGTMPGLDAGSDGASTFHNGQNGFVSNNPNQPSLDRIRQTGP